MILLARPPADAGKLARPIVLVPGEAVPTMTFEAPPRAGRRALEQIARFSLAETLADDPAKLHIVCLRQKDAQPLAYVVAKSQMDAWLDELSSLGVVPAALIPDYLALDWQQGGVSIAHGDGRVVVRTGLLEGFCGEPDLAAAVLATRLDGEERPQAVRHMDARPEGAGEDAVDVVIARAGEAGVAVTRDAFDAFAEANLAAPDTAANLLIGAYRPLSGVVQEARRWRSVGIVAAAVLVLLAISGLVDLGKREAELTALNTDIEKMYRDAFDPTGPIVDVRTQAERALANLRQGADRQLRGDDLAGLLRRAGPTLTNADWQIDAIEFHDGTLFVDVQATSFEALDRLSGALTAAALDVKTVRSAASAKGVDAQLAVKGQNATLGAL